MCIGLRATFTEDFLDFFLRGPLGRFNRTLIGVYFRRVRVCRTILAPDPAELAASRVDICDCRLIERQCNHRLDLCFKLDDHNSDGPPQFDLFTMSERMHRHGLVRMRVETLGKKVEHCHCCPCCCQALRVARRFGPGYVLPSDARPETSGACTGCGRCVEACSVDARSPGRSDRNRCLGCGVCVLVCPEGALSMRSNPVAAKRTRERSLRHNRALAHLLGMLMTIYVLVLHQFFRLQTRSGPAGA